MYTGEREALVISDRGETEECDRRGVGHIMGFRDEGSDYRDMSRVTPRVSVREYFGVFVFQDVLCFYFSRYVVFLIVNMFLACTFWRAHLQRGSPFEKKHVDPHSPQQQQYRRNFQGEGNDCRDNG